MKVKELIAALQKIDSELEVHTCDYEGGPSPVGQVKVVEYGDYVPNWDRDTAMDPRPGDDEVIVILAPADLTPAHHGLTYNRYKK